MLIVDAGGGTIDISAYRQSSQNVQSFEEIAAPQCKWSLFQEYLVLTTFFAGHFHGSIFVTNRAGLYLRSNPIASYFFSLLIPFYCRALERFQVLARYSLHHQMLRQDHQIAI